MTVSGLSVFCLPLPLPLERCFGDGVTGRQSETLSLALALVEWEVV